MNTKFLEMLVAQGGPTPDQYGQLSASLKELSRLPADKLISALEEVRRILAPTLVIDTMQGFAYLKPHGYAGDYEMIERIYQSWTSPHAHLRRWDEYFHEQHAPKAVRNRKQYFINCVNRLEHRPHRILNVASGPARDLHDCLAANPCRHLFTCIDIDADAIEYARNLCSVYGDRVRFIHANALRFSTPERFDLIWSGGLFDYFDDTLFVLMLKRLLRLLTEGGELVVGNFSTSNPSRAYMQLVGEWHLRHREPDELIQLAEVAGVTREHIRVQSEPLGVNLFLHITKRESNKRLQAIGAKARLSQNPDVR